MDYDGDCMIGMISQQAHRKLDSEAKESHKSMDWAFKAMCMKTLDV